MFLKDSQLSRRLRAAMPVRRLLSFIMILQFSGILSLLPHNSPQALANDNETVFGELTQAALFLQQRAVCPECPAMRRAGGVPTAGEFQELSEKILEQQRALQARLDREELSEKTISDVWDYFTMLNAFVFARSSVRTRNGMDTGPLREWLAQFSLRLQSRAATLFANSPRPLMNGKQQGKSVLFGDYVFTRAANGGTLSVNPQFARAAAQAQQDLAAIEGTRNGKPLRENAAFLRSLRSLALLQLRGNLITINLLKSSGQKSLEDLPIPADLERQLDFTQLEAELRAEAEADRLEKALRLQIADRYVRLHARLPKFATRELAETLAKQLGEKAPCFDCGVASEKIPSADEIYADLQRIEREKLVVAFKQRLMNWRFDGEVYWAASEAAVRKSLLDRVALNPIFVFTRYLTERLLPIRMQQVSERILSLDDAADRVRLQKEFLDWKEESEAVIEKIFKEEGERYAAHIDPALIDDLARVAKDKGSLKRSLRNSTLKLLRQSALDMQERFALKSREADLGTLHAVLEGPGQTLGIAEKARREFQKTTDYAKARQKFLTELAALTHAASPIALAVDVAAQGRQAKKVPSNTRYFTDIGLDEQLAARERQLLQRAGHDRELRDVARVTIESERTRAKAWAEWGKLYGFDLVLQDGVKAPSPNTLFRSDSILLKAYFDTVRDTTLDSFPVLSAPITRGGQTRPFSAWLISAGSTQHQELFDEALAYVEQQARSNHEKIGKARSLAEVEKLVKSSLMLQLVLDRVPELTGPVLAYTQGLLEKSLQHAFLDSLFTVNSLIGLGMMAAQLTSFALGRTSPAGYLAAMPMLASVNAFMRAYSLVFWGIFVLQAYTEYQNMKKSEQDLEEISSLYHSSAYGVWSYTHADFRAAVEDAEKRVWDMKFQLYSMLLIVGGATLYGLHTSARLKKVALDLGKDQKAFGDLGLRVGKWDEIEEAAARLRRGLGDPARDTRYASAHKAIDESLAHLKGRLARGERWDAEKVLNSMSGAPKEAAAQRATLNEEELRILRALERNWSEELPRTLKKEWGFE